MICNLSLAVSAEDAPSRSCVEAGWPLLSQEGGLLRSPSGSSLQQSKEALTVPLLVGVNRGLQFPALPVPNLQKLQRGMGKRSQRKVQSKECKEFLLICDKFLSVFDYGNKDTSLTKDFKGMYTIDNQSKVHRTFLTFFFPMGHVWNTAAP